jgi:hypothetical protein
MASLIREGFAVKILLDHNVPRPLARELGTHDGSPHHQQATPYNRTSPHGRERRPANRLDRLHLGVLNHDQRGPAGGLKDPNPVMQRFEDSSPCQQLRLLYLCTVFLFAFTATFNTHFDDSQIGDGAQSPEGNPKVSRPRWETCSQCRPTTRLS